MKDDRFSIGKVSKMVQLPSSVLRYWESVFEYLRPEKSPGGTRKYTMQDVEKILKIKDLLYNQKFTIAGAKKELQQDGIPEIGATNPDLYNFIRRELENILIDWDNSSGQPRMKKK
jgi:DNA-binding transcriptional MerR regulator